MPHESLAAVLARVADEAGRAVMAALHHAGADEVSAGMLHDITLEEAYRGAKSAPDGSARSCALWALAMYVHGVEATRQGAIRDPESVARHFTNAHAAALQALTIPAAAPEVGGAAVRGPLAAGIKTTEEVRLDDGTIGLAIAGYASRYHELDAQEQRMGRTALGGIFEQWAADPTPPLYWEHGRDVAIGWRPIGYATDVQLDDTGLHVAGFLPREPDPRRFTGAARSRQREVYDLVRTGKARGYSVGGTYQNVGPELRRWNCNDVSIGRVPILASARFTLRPGAS